jgi:hypothetical protein
MAPFTPPVRESGAIFNKAFHADSLRVFCAESTIKNWCAAGLHEHEASE